MAIAVGSTSNTPTYGTRANSTITAPSGIANGDLLVAVLHVGNSGTTPRAITPPSGFTEVTNSPAQMNDGSYTIAMHVYTKVASGESGNYQFTHTSADTEGYMYRFTGCDTSTPIDVTPVSQIATIAGGGSNGRTTNYSSITTATGGAFLIYAESDWDAVGASAISGSSPTITGRRTGTISLVSDGTLATAGATVPGQGQTAMDRMRIRGLRLLSQLDRRDHLPTRLSLRH